MLSTHKKALVIFSGGQDSTTCLLQAIEKYGANNIQAITFNYGQRHIIELHKATEIAKILNIKQTVIKTDLLQLTTHNALTDNSLPITQTQQADYPNTFVDGRNALFLLLAANYAKRQEINDIIIGVCETDFSHYPDCRDLFIKSMNITLNLALDYPIVIHTPLMWLTKAQIWQLSDDLGYLEFIKTQTHTCYLGIDGGCHHCPSCQLREKGLAEYIANKR